MTTISHLRRIKLLMLGALALLGWLAARTEVFCADGLRYIKQARTIDQGAWERGLFQSVDHPVYPLAIVATHRLVGGDQPDDWQSAAQLAAVIAGVFVVIPIYLVGMELIGPSQAWLACLLIYAVPLNVHVMADTLSESCFLLFWSLSFWSTMRFLRTTRLAWLLPLIGFSVLAYLTRPEGLIVPVSLVGTLALLTVCPALEFPRRTGRWAIGILVLGPMVTAGPFMMLKGGISTKPSLNRVLSLTTPAPAMAVERERPVEPDQSRLKTLFIATKAMLRAVLGAATLPILLLAPFGVVVNRATAANRRCWLLVALTVGLSALAMIRLHDTCGYCTPRHAMMVGWLLITAGAAGLNPVARWIATTMVRITGNHAWSPRMQPLVKPAIVAGCLVCWAPATTAPIERSFLGYRQAGEWLGTRTRPGEGLVDPKGFSLYYAGKTGYTFANLGEGSRDPNVRWVVTHDAHLNGPWDYSKIVRALVHDRRPVRIFPETAEHGIARVYVYDLAQPGDQTAGRADTASQTLK